MRASLIWSPPKDADSVTATLRSLDRQTAPSFEVFVLFPGDEGSGLESFLHPVTFPLSILRASGFNAQDRNRAAAGSAGKLLIFVDGAVCFTREYLEELTDLWEASPNTGILFGPYMEQGTDDQSREIPCFCDRYDLSEKTRLGPMWGVPARVFADLGGFDPSLHYAYEYDLRLRILEQHEPVALKRPLYMVARSRPSSSLAPSQLAPADGENEFRDVLSRALQRRGALLDGAPGPIACPHTDCVIPLVSVLTPVFNGEDYIEASLESVMQGTYANFEFLVVDNGSDDRTAALVQPFLQDPRVRCLSCPARGVSNALNLGIESARGKYVARLDADDMYMPETLSKLVEFMESNPTIGLGVSYYDVIDQKGRRIEEIETITHSEYDRNNILRMDGIGQAQIWHRCVLQKIGGYSPELNYGEDYDVILKATELCEVGRIPESLYRCRRHGNNSEDRIDITTRFAQKTRVRRDALRRRQCANTS
jgi:hypothetical protein